MYRLVLLDFFRQDFVALTWGAGHLTPKKTLGRGAFDQRKGPHGGEFDQKKNVKCPGSARGSGGGWALLDLTHTELAHSSDYAGEKIAHFRPRLCRANGLLCILVTLFETGQNNAA